MGETPRQRDSLQPIERSAADANIQASGGRRTCQPKACSLAQPTGRAMASSSCNRDRSNWDRGGQGSVSTIASL
jgi:hypothetical protein